MTDRFNTKNNSEIPAKPSDLTLRSFDHPEANGRQPIRGEHVWTYIVKLEDGIVLRLELGAESRHEFMNLIAMDLADDADEEASND